LRSGLAKIPQRGEQYTKIKLIFNNDDDNNNNNNSVLTVVCDIFAAPVTVPNRQIFTKKM
jgi:hypothetical protein